MHKDVPKMKKKSLRLQAQDDKLLIERASLVHYYINNFLVISYFN